MVVVPGLPRVTGGPYRWLSHPNYVAVVIEGIALPMVGMLMFVNLALGIVSRVAPQMNIFAVGFPITLVVGLIGIAVTLPMLDQPFMVLMERALDVFSSR